MGVSRNTVRKYVNQSEPVFKCKANRAQPITDTVRPRIDELLEEWSQRTTKKQRITGTRLYQQLITEGYEVGASTVRRIFHEWRRQSKEVYVPLIHRPGDEAQVDFFEVTVDINGKRCKRWMFLMRLMYSGRDFTWIYEHCDQVSFFDGHVRAFTHFGGVPSRCIYDNLSAAVKRVLYPGRELTQRFKALVSHYLFEPCFARVGTGHDKGGVESRGKGIRLQHLVPIPQGKNLDEISEALLQSVETQAQAKKDREGRTVLDKFTEEQKQLHDLPERQFEPRLPVPLGINRKALVVYHGATYSVPEHWKDLEVMAYVGPTDIRFICRDEIIVRDRVRRRQKNIRYTDYLRELSRKPQAVRQVAPELLSELGEPFGELWDLLKETHGAREAGRIFARVLGSVVDHGQQKVGQALRKSLDAGHRHLLELSSITQETWPQEIEVPESLQQYIVESTRASDFDHLLEEVAP